MPNALRAGTAGLPLVTALTGAAKPPRAAERFFDLSVDMLCLADVDGFFKVVNPAWHRTLGWTDDELMSRPYLDYVHPDDREATLAEASKIAVGFQTIHFRNRYRCRDGSYKWLAWTATPAMADGSIYAGARDVTTAVLAEEEAHNLLRQQRARILSVIDSEALTLVFQPIVTLPSREVCGLEALSRFDLVPKRPPEQWFAEAEAVGLRTQLEMCAIRHAVRCVDRLPRGAFLSLNASPETLLSDEFGETVSGFDGERLVVEVTEHAAVGDYEQLKQAIERLRRSGIRLAIDDAGAGYSSMKHIVRLVPEFIKLDLFLTRDIDRDPVKRALASAMVNFGREIGAGLIAEGVETAAELDVLSNLGVTDAQGFYLGRPGRLRG
jgi:PAS domain S-box-containing protein